MYIVDTANHRMLRYSSGTLVETVAGNGAPGDAATAAGACAQLNLPSALRRWTRAGNLFIADTLNHRIRQVTPAERSPPWRAPANAGSPATGDAAIAARLRRRAAWQWTITAISSSRIRGNHRIRLVTPDGIISGGRRRRGRHAASNERPAGMLLDGAGRSVFRRHRQQAHAPRLAPQAAEAAPDPVTLPKVTAVNAASQRQGAVAPGRVARRSIGAGIGPGAGVARRVRAAAAFAEPCWAEPKCGSTASRPRMLLRAGRADQRASAPYTVAGQHGYARGGSVPGKSGWHAATSAVAAAAPALFPRGLIQDAGSNSASSPGGARHGRDASSPRARDSPTAPTSPAGRPLPRIRIPSCRSTADDRRHPGRDPLRRQRSGDGGNAADQRTRTGRVPAARPGSGGVAGGRRRSLPSVTIWMK